MFHILGWSTVVPLTLNIIHFGSHGVIYIHYTIVLTLCLCSHFNAGMDKLISSMKCKFSDFLYQFCTFSSLSLFLVAFLLLLLMMISVNISTGNEEDRMLMTGLHTVTDIFCVGCGSNVGWKYVRQQFYLISCSHNNSLSSILIQEYS